jgi:hypothetical protein
MTWNNLQDSGASVVYYRQLSDGSLIYLLLYLDDMLIAAKSMFEVKRSKYLLGDEFEMKDLGSANKILGLVSTPYDAHLRISTTLAPQNEQEQFMSCVPYSIVAGIVMYAMMCTCPDILQEVRAVSHYMANPGKVHW